MLAGLIELNKEDITELVCSLQARRNELYDNLIFDKTEHERVDKLIDTFSKLIELINQGEKIEKEGKNNVVKFAKVKVLI